MYFQIKTLPSEPRLDKVARSFRMRRMKGDKVMKILTVLLLCGFRILAADSTNEVKLAVGQTYSISLDSNPTTGYSWKLASPTNSVFELVTNSYEPGKHPNGMVGVGGVEHWTIKAIGKGRAELTLDYMRPWEKVAVKTNALTIVCQ